MKSLCIFALFSICFAVITPQLPAQRTQSQDALTAAERNKIEDAGIDADGRIELYADFVGEHADRIKRLAVRTAPGMARAMDHELENFSSVVDETSANLDQYGGRMADIRKSLKKIDKELPRWQEIVKSLPGNSDYQISRDDATGALSDLANQIRELTQKQDAYFKEHKDAKGQQWAEPQ